MSGDPLNRLVQAKVKDPELVQEKRRIIVEAARELFSKKGYHATTMRNIAEAADMNLASIYQYLTSKDDVLYLFYMDIQKQWAPMYHTLIEIPDPVEQLRAYIEAVLEVAYRINDELRTMYTESRHLERDSLQSVLLFEKQTVETVESILDRGVEQGCFRTKDTFMAANIITYFVAFYAMRGWNLRGRYTFSRYVKLVINFIFSALGVDENEREAAPRPPETIMGKGI
ncbi:MAG: TetR/AcrR family transcriptional regulator [Proteobacteria bacterium]|nr:TetR/AcrR family transcriptional regulator [Pseudomonadota bacterium]